MKAGWILHGLAFATVFSTLYYSIWQQWHSYKSYQSYNRRESYNFVFRHVGCVSRILRHNSSSAFSHVENRAKFLIRTQGKIASGQQGSCEEALSNSNFCHC